MRLARALLAVGIVALVAAGCGDDEDDASGRNNRDGEPSLRIRSPEEGATVDCPVRVRVATGGMRVMGKGAEPPQEPEDGRAAKLYGFVDAEPPGVGQPVPAPDGIGVIAGNRDGVRLRELPPGPHKVTLVATDGGGVVLDPLVQAAVSFTVGTCAPPPPGEGEAEAPPPG